LVEGPDKKCHCKCFKEAKRIDNKKYYLKIYSMPSGKPGGFLMPWQYPSTPAFGSMKYCVKKVSLLLLIFIHIFKHSEEIRILSLFTPKPPGGGLKEVSFLELNYTPKFKIMRAIERMSANLNPRKSTGHNHLRDS
jgi:hypothetical protein